MCTPYVNLGLGTNSELFMMNPVHVTDAFGNTAKRVYLEQISVTISLALTCGEVFRRSNMCLLSI